MAANDMQYNHKLHNRHAADCKRPAPVYIMTLRRRGDRVADCAALEMLCTLTGTQGSNPCLSAIFIIPKSKQGSRSMLTDIVARYRRPLSSAEVESHP